MTRRLLNLLAAASLLLCAATCVLSAGSYEVRSGSVWSEAKPVGRLRWTASINVNGPALSVGRCRPRAGRPLRHGPIAGFEYVEMPAYAEGPGTLVTIGAYRGVNVPLWAIAIGFELLPMHWLRRHLRARRRASQQQCVRCGYYLRATPGRCPECGAVPRVPTISA